MKNTECNGLHITRHRHRAGNISAMWCVLLSSAKLSKKLMVEHHFTVEQLYLL
jgi:hypothetical protein